MFFDFIQFYSILFNFILFFNPAQIRANTASKTYFSYLFSDNLKKIKRFILRNCLELYNIKNKKLLLIIVIFSLNSIKIAIR